MWLDLRETHRDARAIRDDPIRGAASVGWMAYFRKNDRAGGRSEMGDDVEA
jgi:hypothetical protein